MHTPAVLTEGRGGVLVVTLNRPEARNAINDELSLGVAEALTRLDDNDDLRVAVINGSGGNFCAGMDLRTFVDRPPEDAAAALARLVRRPSRKPVIAAIEGFAVGGGLELALACDLIVVALDAQLGIPEVRLSMVPSGGALLRLPDRLPYGVVLDMALSGEPISGQRAFDLGLASRVAETGAALDASLALASRIATSGPMAVAGSIELLASPAITSGAEWERQFAVTMRVNQAPDALEGIRAFLEKRSPTFTSKA